MTVEVFSPERFEILFRDRWTTTGLAEETAQINRGLLQREFEELARIAPRRAESGLSYFKDERDGSITTAEHQGETSASSGKRFEEHLAMALWSLGANWPCNESDSLHFLDYQFPLKAVQDDKRIGKIDLLGLTDKGRMVIVELKVPPRSKGNRGEPPVSALIQGLRYAAIVQANHAPIAREVQNRFGKQVIDLPPVVQILAPKQWWARWADLADSTRRKAGKWEREFLRLSRDVEEKIGIGIECLALDIDERDLDYSVDGRTPRLGDTPSISLVLLDQSVLFGPPLGSA